MNIVSRKIVLLDYQVMASIGIHDFEKAARQRLLITVELTLSSPPPERDDISATLDYDFLRTGIGRLVDSGHFQLQETLSHAILALCQSQPGISHALVSTRKPDVYPDCAAIGYTVEAAFS